MSKESVEYNVSTILPSLGLKPVTGSAFSKARYKIDLSFFKDLNKILEGFHKRNPSILWRGYQLIAGDGSTVGLPPSGKIKDFFGVHSKKSSGIKSCMAQIFMLYGVFSGAVLSKRIPDMSNSEKTLFRECLPELSAGKSIVILDRGFGYFNICKELSLQEQHFCIRISNAQSSFSKRVMDETENDFIIEWEASPKERETCLTNGISAEKITVRATKVQLKTGEIEILISSLIDMNDVCTQDMKAVYALGWPVEEGFKKLKPKMKLEQFGSRKPEGIFQEFEAHIFMVNLIALLGIQAQLQIDGNKKRKLKYKYNWQNAFRYVRKQIVQVPNKIDQEEIIKLLIKLISKSKIPIKPDRNFPRNTFKKRKNRPYQTYK